jgi:hypothetical protein
MQRFTAHWEEKIYFFYFSEVRRTNKSVFESRDYPTNLSFKKIDYW